MKLQKQQYCFRYHRLAGTISALALSGMAITGQVSAAELLDNENLQIRWDNTVKYQAGFRTKSPSRYNLSNPNTNDGTGAFDKGDLITNRADILSEFDLSLKDAAHSGLRVSAAGWYDNVYDRQHDRIDAATYNQISVDNDEFTRRAKEQAGRGVELLDAFIHSGFDLGDNYLSWRLGRHTLLWGESLFLATNGISNGQAPNDGLKALSVPSSLAKELFLPVNQLSMALSLSDSVSVEGYYQLEYRPTRVPAPGTYWSTFDGGFKGGETLVLAPGFAIPRGDEDKPEGAKGQWGVALKYRDYDNDMDYGLYYLRYNAKIPQVYTRVSSAFIPQEYFFVYPESIKLYGLSASTKIGDANVAGEISFRDNQPLVSDGNQLVIVDDQPGNGHANRLYAVGQTIHAQVSTIWILPRAPLWDQSQLTAELGGHHLYKVTENEERRDKDTVRTSVGMRTIFEPTWYQAFPSVDVSTPLTLGYNFTGRSAVDPSFNTTGAAHGGDVGLSLNFKYANNLRGGVSYTHYLGDSQDNAYADRDLVLFNLAYSF